jgi:DNA (cytosine-5)-methyltransferase 1
MQFNLFDHIGYLDDREPYKNDWFGSLLDTLEITDNPGWPDRFGENLSKLIASLKIPVIKTLSLFSGGGGLDIAFHSAGFEILELIEIDSRFAATLEQNAKNGLLGQAKVRCMDIREFAAFDGQGIDFVIGGPPCQTFSAAGRRAAGVKGIADPRGTLFEEYVRILKIFRPKGFLFENVYGITGAQGGEAWRQIQQAFAEVGYTLHWRVLDAADYGVPQHRERLFIVGIRAGECKYQFPRPTHGPDSDSKREHYSAGKAVQGAQRTDGASLAINGRWGHLIAEIPPGLNYSYFTKEMAYPNPIFSWRSKFSDFMYKADPNAPVRTIKAQGGLYTGPFSWENRHFSVHEIKRLQTFPDIYEVAGKRQVALHQIGNSVPPQMGRILALSILHQIFKVDLPFSIGYLESHEELGFRQRKRLLTDIYQCKARDAKSKSTASKARQTLGLHDLENQIGYLTDDFNLSLKPIKNALPYQFQYESTDGILQINALSPLALKSASSASISLRMEVFTFSQNHWNIPLEKAILTGQAESILIFTALWKAFENAMRKTFGIDDLVQLSGYYQYSPKLRACMSINLQEDDVTPELKALKAVVSGRCIASQISIEQAAQLFDVALPDMPRILRFLKTLGYEVRNHNTNSQIPEGECLIPYAFPTLTPKSVQLRKHL